MLNYLADWLPLGGFLTGIAGLITAFVLVAKFRSEVSKILAERDEARKRTAKTESDIVTDLQTQLGKAIVVNGELQDAVMSLHKKDDEQEIEIITLNRKVAAANETVASLSEVNAQLMVERKVLANEKAILQKKLIESEADKTRLVAEMEELRQELATLRGKVQKMEEMTGALRKVTDELRDK